MSRPGRWQVRNNLLARTTLRISFMCEDLRDNLNAHVASSTDRTPPSLSGNVGSNPTRLHGWVIAQSTLGILGMVSRAAKISL